MSDEESKPPPKRKQTAHKTGAKKARKQTLTHKIVKHDAGLDEYHFYCPCLEGMLEMSGDDNYLMLVCEGYFKDHPTDFSVM